MLLIYTGYGFLTHTHAHTHIAIKSKCKVTDFTGKWPKWHIFTGISKFKAFKHTSKHSYENISKGTDTHEEIIKNPVISLHLSSNSLYAIKSTRNCLNEQILMWITMWIAMWTISPPQRPDPITVSQYHRWSSWSTPHKETPGHD